MSCGGELALFCEEAAWPSVVDVSDVSSQSERTHKARVRNARERTIKAVRLPNPDKRKEKI